MRVPSRTQVARCGLGHGEVTTSQLASFRLTLVVQYSTYANYCPWRHCTSAFLGEHEQAGLERGGRGRDSAERGAARRRPWRHKLRGRRGLMAAGRPVALHRAPRRAGVRPRCRYCCYCCCCRRPPLGGPRIVRDGRARGRVWQLTHTRREDSITNQAHDQLYNIQQPERNGARQSPADLSPRPAPRRQALMAPPAPVPTAAAVTGMRPTNCPPTSRAETRVKIIAHRWSTSATTMRTHARHERRGRGRWPRGCGHGDSGRRADVAQRLRLLPTVRGMDGARVFLVNPPSGQSNMANKRTPRTDCPTLDASMNSSTSMSLSSSSSPTARRADGREGALPSPSGHGTIKGASRPTSAASAAERGPKVPATNRWKWWRRRRRGRGWGRQRRRERRRRRGEAGRRRRR